MKPKHKKTIWILARIITQIVAFWLGWKYGQFWMAK